MTGTSPWQAIYEVDSADRIRQVTDAWRRFARSNTAVELCEGMEGRSIWDSLAGDETKEIYQIVFQRVREERRTIILPFRCDSPSLRRFMELKLAPISGGVIRTFSRVLKAEPTSYLRILENGNGSAATLKICSWCKYVKIDSSNWMEIEQAARQQELFDLSLLPKLDHTVCPSCSVDLYERLK